MCLSRPKPPAVNKQLLRLFKHSTVSYHTTCSGILHAIEHVRISFFCRSLPCLAIQRPEAPPLMSWIMEFRTARAVSGAVALTGLVLFSAPTTSFRDELSLLGDKRCCFCWFCLGFPQDGNVKSHKSGRSHPENTMASPR